MNRQSLSFAIAAAFAATLALSACKRDEPAPTTTVDTAPAPAPAPAPTPAPAPAPAAVVTAVDLGSSVDADGRVVAGTSTFATTDTITASVMTNTGSPTASATGTLGARWTFQDGQVVNQESKTFNFTGPGVTNFTISKPDGWPVGRYKVEISLDGAVVQTRDFEVR
jgi:hypothetical protein